MPWGPLAPSDDRPSPPGHRSTSDVEPLRFRQSIWPQSGQKSCNAVLPDRLIGCNLGSYRGDVGALWKRVAQVVHEASREILIEEQLHAVASRRS